MDCLLRLYPFAPPKPIIRQSLVTKVTEFPGGGAADRVTTNWFDWRGRLVATKGGTAVSTTDGGGDSGWSDAGDVSGDTVLEQAEYAYDAAGNVLLVTTRQLFHDETGTGALGTPTSGVHARVSYVGYYYDGADRLTD